MKNHWKDVEKQKFDAELNSSFKHFVYVTEIILTH